MDVYYNGNGNIWGKGKARDKLTKIPVNRTFSWETQTLFIPAMYVNESALVLDVCIPFPVSDMLAFFQKWDRERRLSLHTHEDYEQMEADNPAVKNFSADLCLDDQPLSQRMFGSILWYPVEFLQAEAKETGENEPLKNDTDAEQLMEVYECDRTLCWYFERLVYLWKQEPILTPQEISLTFHARELSVTTDYFTTDDSQIFPMEIKTTHPATGTEYTLTLHEYEQVRQSFDNIGEKDMCYPEYARTLSYRISPEIEPNTLYIRDVSESDSPRPKNEDEGISIPASSGGPTAIFLTGKSPVKNRHLAYSALHFALVSEVRWRILFQTKAMEDLDVCIAL